MNAAYVKVPLAIFEGLEDRSITPEQFDIFAYCYFKADREGGYRVRSYCAANVCNFRGLDADQGNVKRYRRAATKLEERNLIKRDYFKIDTTQSDKAGRTYSVWIPRPDRFKVIGTPEENLSGLWPKLATETDENKESLSISAFVPLVVPDYVPLPDARSAVSAMVSDKEKRDTVPLLVPLFHHNVSINNQEERKSEKEIPLNPPVGGLLPPAPSGSARPAGVENLHMKSKGKALDTAACELLKNAALAYITFMVDFYRFSPDREHIVKLLRRYKPTELVSAQVSRFSPLDYRKKDLAHFFAKAASDSIDAARRLGTSAPIPEWLVSNSDCWQAYAEKWDAVLAAWNKIGIDGQQDAGFSNLTIAVQERRTSARAKQAGLAQQNPAPIAVVSKCKTCGTPVPLRRVYCGSLGCENLEFLEKRNQP